MYPKAIRVIKLYNTPANSDFETIAYLSYFISFQTYNLYHLTFPSAYTKIYKPRQDMVAKLRYALKG